MSSAIHRCETQFARARNREPVLGAEHEVQRRAGQQVEVDRHGQQQVAAHLRQGAEAGVVAAGQRDWQRGALAEALMPLGEGMRYSTATPVRALQSHLIVDGDARSL